LKKVEGIRTGAYNMIALKMWHRSYLCSLLHYCVSWIKSVTFLYYILPPLCVFVTT